jgi:phage gpG-like protein
VSFKVKAIGFGELDRKFKALGRQISPQVGVAESLSFGAEVIRILAMDNAVAQGLIESGALVDSVVTVKVNQYRVDIRVGVPYGAIHEYGDTVTITDRQRRFFWAMWAKTNDSMWKALALSQTYTIKARPYVRPAIDEGKRIAGRETARAFREQIRRAVT